MTARREISPELHRISNLLLFWGAVELSSALFAWRLQRWEATSCRLAP